MLCPRSTNRGFLTLEAVLGVLFLAIVATAGGLTILKISQSIAHHRQAKKAAVLAENVLEFYQDKSIGSFNLLSSYDRTNLPIQNFLPVPNNTGKFNVTTVAAYNDNRSSCTVSVTLSWFDAKGANEMVFKKTFSERAAMMGGGTVNVYVKYPCGGFTTTQAIIANCPGIQGLTISAPANANSSITMEGYTDSSGKAVLRGIKQSQNTLDLVKFVAKAPAPSSYTILINSPQYTTGYYRLDIASPFGVSLEDSSSTYVGGRVSTVLFTNFKKMGRITGSALDTAGNLLPAKAGIQLLAPAVVVGETFLSEGFDTCSDEQKCIAYADPARNGRYEFNNVLPTTNADLVGDPGIVGTPAESTSVHWGDAGFVKGYIDKTVRPHLQNEWALSVTTTTATPRILQDFRLKHKGSVRIRLMNGVTPVNSPDAKVKLYMVANQPQWWDVGDRLSELVLPRPDANGYVYLNNVIDSDTQYTTSASTLPVVYAWIPPGGPYQDGLYGALHDHQYGWTCSNCMDRLTAVDLPMVEGTSLEGDIDSPTGIALDGHDGGIPSGIPYVMAELRNSSPPHTHGGGRFRLRGIWPAMHLSSYGSYYDYSGDTFETWGGLWGGTNITSTLRVIGVEASTLTSWPPSGPVRRAAQIHFQASAISSGWSGPILQTTADGTYTFTSEDFPFISSFDEPFTITCTQPSGPCAATPTISSHTAEVRAPRTPYPDNDEIQIGSYDYRGWWGGYPITAGGSTDAQVPCYLKQYNVHGFVKDSLGNPLANIPIYNGSDRVNELGRTDPSGFYSFYFKPTFPGYTVWVALTGSQSMGNVLPVTPLCINPATSATTAGSCKAGDAGCPAVRGSVICGLPDPLMPDWNNVLPGAGGLRQDFTMNQVVLIGGGL